MEPVGEVDADRRKVIVVTGDVLGEVLDIARDPG
jgi:hypothetical protein